MLNLSKKTHGQLILEKRTFNGTRAQGLNSFLNNTGTVGSYAFKDNLVINASTINDYAFFNSDNNGELTLDHNVQSLGCDISYSYFRHIFEGCDFIIYSCKILLQENIIKRRCFNSINC